MADVTDADNAHLERRLDTARLTLQIGFAVDVASRYAAIDGAHHKQWVIDQMLRHLLGDDYTAWVEEYNAYARERALLHDVDYAPWEVGVAP